MAGNPYLWSTTAATNSSADSDIAWPEGQLPSTVNDSARGMMAGIAGWLKDTNSTLTTGGSANAQTVTSNVAYTALATGIRLHLKAGFTNTGACTLNLTPAGGGAFGVKAIKIVTTAGEADPTVNNIRADGHYILEYDSAANAAAGAWILLNPSVGLVIAAQVFTASGTYTPRTGILYAVIEGLGGGGGGGSASGGGGTELRQGGGGGSGGYSRKVVSAASIGASQTVTIGAAGAGGGGAGTAGGTTSVGSLVTALGGSGGAVSSTAYGVGGAGGAVGTGDFAALGAAGGTGSYASASTVLANTGNGADSLWGSGGYVGLASGGSATFGSNATGYGAGGGGATAAYVASSANGGNGSPGVVIITEYSAA